MSTTGIVFNIQKFSLHDGPGIRTTVFLKGCPLRCKWCSNPESQSFDMEITWEASKCIHCLRCVNQCPTNAIRHENEQIIIDSASCDNLQICINNCPSKALRLEGEYQSVTEIVDICLQDLDFYKESGGGVTISGGEGMGQPAFLKKLVRMLHDKDIHVAIETTGFIAPKVFQSLAPLFDLLLFDVKHYEPAKHKEGTGVSNDIIIENLKWAIDHKIHILPRIPVIPTFNAEIEDALGLAQLFKKMGITSVQLLPFHQFGEKKYAQLHKKYEFSDVKALYPEDLEEYKNVFLKYNIDCFI